MALKSSSSSVLRSYLSLVAKPNGLGLRRDAVQVAVAERLDDLLFDLSGHKENLSKYMEANLKYEEELQRQARQILKMKLEEQKNSFGGFFSSGYGEKPAGPGRTWKLEREANLEAENIVGPRPRKPAAPKSIYLHGQVGAGKTFLMDLFYSNAQNILVPGRSGEDSDEKSIGIGTRRLHFNAAMMELHQNMHRIEQSYYQKEKFKVSNPGKLAVMAARRRRVAGHSFIAGESFTISSTLEKASKELFKLNTGKQGHLGLVCFDEMQVPDGFTAISIMSMFRLLFQEEAVVVSTSNCSPYELNDNAWFNDHYDNFTQMMLEKCEVIELSNGIDYRTISLSQNGASKNEPDFSRFFYPQSEASTSMLTRYINENKVLYDSLETIEKVKSRTIDVMFGRVLSLPTIGHHIARIDFLDFFSQPVGPADCLAIARSFKLVCIENIPVLNRQKRDQARRFITLVDEIYNEGCLLVCTAAASPQTLFKSDELGESLLDLESLQFEAEALTDAKSRVDSNIIGGVAPEATSQRIGTEEGSKFFAKKITGEEEQFAFKRAVSRILEMQGDVYFQRHRKMQMLGGAPLEAETSEEGSDERLGSDTSGILLETKSLQAAE